MLVNLSREIYSVVLKQRTPITMMKLNEKIMTSKQAMMETIINANEDNGRPKIIAFLRMFLYG
ncbi:hypothetical protein G3I01_14860 [Gramella sp. MT6]|uniref:hypothetical protein n=1 Tax=Gramella sp. MT6 TaxID=2705471 RepID=UPI001C5D7EFC|nr:hypothetical protein [Gramella sp. MT6]QYA26718.1 hypothetical protein G3I01_14860 [Gramella sp. MT6]